MKRRDSEMAIKVGKGKVKHSKVCVRSAHSVKNIFASFLPFMWGSKKKY